jgi:hypothetical protein
MPYIIAVIAIVILGVGFTLLQSRDETITTTEVATETPVQELPAPTSVTPETAGTNNVPQPSALDYADGTYKTQVTYQTPARAEYLMDVSLTVSNDFVTTAKIVYSNGAEKDPNAAKFEAAYKTEVIGKDIDTLNLSRIGGASLTTAAFNNALVSIKADAKS